MRSLTRLYDWLVHGLAFLGGASLAFITVAIVVDVTLRNLGLFPFRWTSAVVEYVLLFSTVAAAPWLVRTGGHVAVDSFVKMLPSSLQALVGRAVIAISALLLAFLAWRATKVGLEQFAANTYDMRSINIPGWIAYGLLAGGFALMAVEFLRLLAKGEIAAGSGQSH